MTTSAEHADSLRPSARILKYGIPALPVIFAVSGCALGPVRYHKSEDDLWRVGKACQKHLKNELMAQKECFPLLRGREVLMEIMEIKLNALNQVEVVGRTSADLDVHCTLNADQGRKLAQNPSSLQLGTSAWVSGKFTNFYWLGFTDGMTASYSFYLSECSTRNWDEAKDLPPALEYQEQYRKNQSLRNPYE